MYDEVSADYDRFVNWQNRLPFELPFIEQQLQAVGARRVLDAACGTGMHAISLAQRGYAACGADLSAPMVAKASANATAAGVPVPFTVAGLGELSTRVGTGLDTVLCLGNSLPHVLDDDGLHDALADFARCLRPGGLLLLQNRNFDAVLTRRERWMEPQSYREGQREWVFLRFYDFEADGTLAFHMLTLQRMSDEPWSQHIHTTRLRPWCYDKLQAALLEASFENVRAYGDLQGHPFDAARSPNLVWTARRQP